LLPAIKSGHSESQQTLNAELGSDSDAIIDDWLKLKSLL